MLRRASSQLLTADWWRVVSYIAPSLSQPGTLQPWKESLVQDAPPTHQLRGLKLLRRKFPLPPEIQTVLQRKTEEAQAKKPGPLVLPPPTPTPLTATSRRVGCLAYKAGMTQDWDEHGARVPLTVLWIDDCQVVAVRWPAMHGYTALQLGLGYRKQEYLHPGMVGYYLAQGVPFKDQLVEFPVSPDSLLPVGTPITAAHFVAGQHVDVTGWTKWKGFQGVMKKWNFKGLPASHGVSLAHRSPGSIGCRTDPGKVWKGKKMPGNMGDERRTVHDCLVYKCKEMKVCNKRKPGQAAQVDAARNLVYIQGQVPGPAGRMVLLRDAFNTPHARRMAWDLPFPTYLGPGAAVLADTGRGGVPRLPGLDPVLRGPLSSQDTAALALAVPAVTVAQRQKDPYRQYVQEVDYFGVKWKKTD
ncbi:hypothetical protein QJQ45_009749 [Haematococcus lacustris]|nr:hypothetical protein QJQ45_009749 [Haematococcus lacustris]